MAGEFRAVADFYVPVRTIDPQCDRFLGREDLNAEASRLNHRAAGQVRPTQSGRKPKVVLDPGTNSCLSPRRIPLNENGLETFRSSVNTGREPGRTAADNDQVEKVRVGPQFQTDSVRKVSSRRIAQAGAVRKK